MDLNYTDEIPRVVAVKLLRAACDDGEEGERFKEGLTEWKRRGGTVDKKVVRAFGLDDGYEEEHHLR